MKNSASDFYDAVRRAAPVITRDAQGNLRGKGRVIGYTDEPQVLVEYPDGHKEWWLARLTAADRPSVTDNARAEAKRRYPDRDDYRTSLGSDPEREGKRHAFIAGVLWAAGRAETTTEEWPRCKASRGGGCDRCHDEHGRHVHCRADTTTEDVREL